MANSTGRCKQGRVGYRGHKQYVRAGAHVSAVALLGFPQLDTTVATLAEELVLFAPGKGQDLRNLLEGEGGFAADSRGRQLWRKERQP